VLLILNFVAPRVELSDILGGPGSCGESPEPSTGRSQISSVGFTPEVESGAGSTGARKEIDRGSTALRDA